MLQRLSPKKNGIIRCPIYTTCVAATVEDAPIISLVIPDMAVPWGKEFVISGVFVDDDIFEEA